MNADLPYGEAITRNYGKGPVSEAVEEGIFRLLEAASSAGGTIDEITPEGDGRTAKYSIIADAKVVDGGFCPAEYCWSEFCHRETQPQLCDESDIEVYTDNANLASAGIRVDQASEGDVIFDGDGDDVYCVCHHTYAVTVTDEEEFRKWAETWLERDDGQKELARIGRTRHSAA